VHTSACARSLPLTIQTQLAGCELAPLQNAPTSIEEARLSVRRRTSRALPARRVPLALFLAPTVIGVTITGRDSHCLSPCKRRAFCSAAGSNHGK